MNYRYIEELTKPADSVYGIEDALKWLNVLGYEAVGDIRIKVGEHGIQLKCSNGKTFYTDIALDIDNENIRILGTKHVRWIPSMRVNRNSMITGFLDKTGAMDIDSIAQCISKKGIKVIRTNCYNVRNNKWESIYCLQLSSAEFRLFEDSTRYLRDDETSCIIMKGPYLIGDGYGRNVRKPYLAEVIRKSELGLDIIVSTAEYYNKKVLMNSVLG